MDAQAVSEAEPPASLARVRRSDTLSVEIPSLQTLTGSTADCDVLFTIQVPLPFPRPSASAFSPVSLCMYSA